MLENLPPKRACRQILQNPTSKRRIHKIVGSPSRKLPASSTITSPNINNEPTRLQHPTANIIANTKKPTRKSTKIMRSMINSTKNRVTRSSLQILKIADSKNSKRQIVQHQKVSKVSSRDSSANEKSNNTSSSSQSTGTSTVSSEDVTSTSTISATLPVSMIDSKVIEQKPEGEMLSKDTEIPTKQTSKQPFMKTLQQNTKRVIKKISQPFKKPQKIRTTRHSINQKPIEPLVEDVKETVNEDAVVEIENDPLPAVTAKKASTKSKLKKIVRKLSVRKTKTEKVALKEQETTTVSETAVAVIDTIELVVAKPEVISVKSVLEPAIVEVVGAAATQPTKESEEKALQDDKKDPLKNMLRSFRRKRKTVDEVEAVDTETTNTSSEPEILSIDVVTPEPGRHDKPTESGRLSHPLLKHILEAPSTSTVILPAISSAVTSNSSMPLYVHTASTESINELTTPRSSGPPASPLKTPPGKKKVKRISDCIAMLTGKLQQKMGVPFFESTVSPIARPPSNLLQTEISPLPLDMSSGALISPTPIDENGCLDLSLPKKNKDQQQSPIMVSPPLVIITPSLPGKSNQLSTSRKPRKPAMPSVTIKQPTKKFTPDTPDNRAIIEKLLCNNVEVTQITGEPPINRRKPTKPGEPSPIVHSNVTLSKLNVSLLDSSLKVAPENASTPNSTINRSLSSRQSQELVNSLGGFTLPSPVLPLKPLTELVVKPTPKPTPEIKRILKESQFPAGLLQLHQNETIALVGTHEVGVNKPTEDVIVAKPLVKDSCTTNLLPSKDISLNPFAIPIIMEMVVPVAPPIVEFTPVESTKTEEPIPSKPTAKKGKKCKKLIAKVMMEQNSSAEQPSVGEVSAEISQLEMEDTSKVLKGLVPKKRGRKPKSQSNSTNPDEATSSLSSINNSLNNLTLDSKNSSPEKCGDSATVAEKTVENTAEVVKPIIEDMWTSEATTNVVMPKKTETRGRKPKVKAVAVFADEIQCVEKTQAPITEDAKPEEEMKSIDILPSKSSIDGDEPELVNSVQVSALLDFTLPHGLYILFFCSSSPKNVEIKVKMIHRFH
jgi:hypothetical protein